MRKVFMESRLGGTIAVIVFIFVGSSAIAQTRSWTWKPWSSDIGVSPFADIYYAVSTSDSVGAYKLERTGLDFIGGVQADISPIYIRCGFSNFRGLLPPNPNDTTSFSLFFAHWRVGFQFSSYKATVYKGTTYDLSVLLVTNVIGIGNAKFLGVMAEGTYFRNIAGIDIFGAARGGLENTEIPDGTERNEKTMGASIVAEWHKEFITPYIGASITSPITGGKMELRWLVSVGIQLALPYTYVARLPSIAYPRVFRKK